MLKCFLCVFFFLFLSVAMISVNCLSVCLSVCQFAKLCHPLRATCKSTSILLDIRALSVLFSTKYCYLYSFFQVSFFCHQSSSALGWFDNILNCRCRKDENLINCLRTAPTVWFNVACWYYKTSYQTFNHKKNWWDAKIDFTLSAGNIASQLVIDNGVRYDYKIDAITR